MLVAGTFLPWLKSGRASRNSYQASGAVRRLVDPPDPLGVLFTVWPLLALASGAAAALFLLGIRRAAAVLGTVTALIAGAAAFGAVKSTSSAYASVIISGPTTTLIGAALVVVASPVCTMRARPAPRSTP
ncbi:MAG: hypothetical protein M3070_07610 [Actinomycetota bacterium]|nr:hypothetical protein [Actinomycetota bacterium]